MVMNSLFDVWGGQAQQLQDDEEERRRQEQAAVQPQDPMALPQQAPGQGFLDYLHTLPQTPSQGGGGLLERGIGAVGNFLGNMGITPLAPASTISEALGGPSLNPNLATPANWASNALIGRDVAPDIRTVGDIFGAQNQAMGQYRQGLEQVPGYTSLPALVQAGVEALPFALLPGGPASTVGRVATAFGSGVAGYGAQQGAEALGAGPNTQQAASLLAGIGTYEGAGRLTRADPLAGIQAPQGAPTGVSVQRPSEFGDFTISPDQLTNLQRNVAEGQRLVRDMMANTGVSEVEARRMLLNAEMAPTRERYASARGDYEDSIGQLMVNDGLTRSQAEQAYMRAGGPLSPPPTGPVAGPMPYRPSMESVGRAPEAIATPEGRLLQRGNPGIEGASGVYPEPERFVSPEHQQGYYQGTLDAQQLPPHEFRVTRGPDDTDFQMGYKEARMGYQPGELVNAPFTPDIPGVTAAGEVGSPPTSPGASPAAPAPRFERPPTPEELAFGTSGQTAESTGMRAIDPMATASTGTPLADIPTPELMQRLNNGQRVIEQTQRVADSLMRDGYSHNSPEVLEVNRQIALAEDLWGQVNAELASRGAYNNIDTSTAFQSQNAGFGLQGPRQAPTPEGPRGPGGTWTQDQLIANGWTPEQAFDYYHQQLQARTDAAVARLGPSGPNFGAQAAIAAGEPAMMPAGVTTTPGGSIYPRSASVQHGGAGPAPAAAQPIPQPARPGVNTTYGQPAGVTPSRGMAGGNAPPIQRDATIGLTEIINTPRQLMAGGDWSYFLRQMLYAGPRHPFQFLSAVGKGIRATFDPAYAQDVAQRIQDNPYRQGGLMQRQYLSPNDSARADIFNRDEGYISSGIVGRIPGVGPFFQAMERGNVTGLNDFRNSLGTNYAETSLRAGGIDPAAYKAAIANGERPTVPPQVQQTINRFMGLSDAFTGRGHLGPLEKSQLLTPINQAFFSIRNLMSMPQKVAPLATNVPFTPVWNEAASTMAAFIGTGITTLALAKMAGLDVGDDWRKGDFGKIVSGRQHIDIWGGWSPIVRAAIQGEESARGNYNKSLSTIGLTFLGNKLSPQAAQGGQIALAELQDKMSPETYDKLRQVWPENRALSWGDAWKLIVPLWIQDVRDGIQQDQKSGGSGLTGGAVGALSALGVGVQSYPPSTSEVRSTVLSDPQRLTAAFPDNPGMSKALANVDPSTLTGREKAAIATQFTSEEQRVIDDRAKQLRSQNDPFQKGRDLSDMAQQKADIIRQGEAKALEEFDAMKKDGKHDAVQIRLAESALRQDVQAQLNKVYAPVNEFYKSDYYKNAVAGLPERGQNDLQSFLTAYRALGDSDAFKTKDGYVDTAKLQAAQQAMLADVKSHNPDLGTRLEFNTKTDDSWKPASQLYYEHVVRPIVQEWGPLDGKASTDWLRAHPEQEAILWAAGYVGQVHGQQAANIAHQMVPARQVLMVR